VKDEIEPATVGLPEILRMQAKQYIRLRPTDRPPRPGGGEWPVLAPLREVGFLAQDLRDVLPLAVHEIGDEMPTAHLARDDEGPLLAISYDTITTALVNAVKTLNGRLVKLEGRH
jgi:hypothetical protein